MGNLFKPFTIPEDSCHLIEYYSVDKVEKTEEIKKQCVFVDNEAPEVEKILEGDKVLAEGQYELGWEIPDEYDVVDAFFYVNQDTEIILECSDSEPHPVNDVTIYYKYYNDGQLIQDWIEYNDSFKYDKSKKTR